MPRDNFPANVIDKLARRSGCLCNNPDCQDPFTSLPHSDSGKFTNLGVAAHIRAASPGGARYDASQTQAQRSSIGNGIWLCQRCAAQIDKDERHFTVSLLQEWKRDHEQILASAPQRAQLFVGSPSRPASDSKVARDLLIFFGDRRVLFENYAWEVPHEIWQSVDLIRSELRRAESRILPSSELSTAIQFLRDTFQTFLREAGDLSSRERGLRGASGPIWQIRNALAALRKSCGFQLADIATAYSLILPTTLEGVCPKPKTSAA